MTVEKRIEMKESIDTISSVTIELQEASHQNDDKEIPLKLKKDRIKRVKEFVRSTGFKKTARSTLAFMLSVLVCLIAPIAKPFGTIVFLVPVSVCLLYSDTSISAASIGGVLQTTVRFSFTILLASAASLASLQIAKASNAPAVLWEFFFFLLIFFASYIRAKYPKEWTISMLIAKVIIIIAFVVGWRNDFEDLYTLIGNVMGSLLAGTAISVFCMFVAFPQSAGDSLRLEIIDSLENVELLLKLNTMAFLQEASKEDFENMNDIRKKTASNFSKLSVLLNDTKLELNYGNFSTAELSAITNSNRKMIQHVWSLISCLSPEKNYTHQDIITQLVNPIKDSVNTLSMACRKDLLLARKWMKNQDVEISNSALKSLDQATNEFNKNQEKVARKFFLNDDVSSGVIENNPFEEVFRLYFWIFSFKEFVEQLRELLEVLSRVQTKKSLHFPLRLWKVEKKQDLRAMANSDVNHNKRFALWKVLNEMDSWELKFGLKTALSMTLIAILQFLPATQHFFRDWRGEWALVTVAVVIAPTFGGNYINGFYRFFGTITGAAWAIVSYYLCDYNPYGSFFMILVFAAPCIWITQTTKYPKLGVVALLTLTVVLLSKYADPTLHPIYELAYKRSLITAIGILVVFLVSRFFWPYLARKTLRKELSETFHNTAFLYSKLVSTFASKKVTDDQVHEFEKLETKIQLNIVKHSELLVLASSEPRLKGKLDSVTFQEIIDGCQFILDLLRSTRHTIMKGFGKRVKREVVMPLQKDRAQMIGDILMYFYILAGALRTRAPLPHYLPNARKSRDILLFKFRNLPAVKEGLIHKTHLEFIHYYAYSLAMKEMIGQLEKLGELVKRLYGEYNFVTGLRPSESFSRLSQEDIEGLRVISNRELNSAHSKTI